MGNHSKLTTKQKVFKWLRAGKTQTWISIKKKINKGLVSVYAKEFVDAGLLEIIDKKARTKLYKPTPIGLNFKVNKMTGEKSTYSPPTLPLGGESITVNNYHDPPKIRHHRLGYKIKVISEIKREIYWDKTNIGLKGITQYFLYWPSEKVEHSTIRYQPSNKKGEFGEIVVWPPQKELTFEEWKYWEQYLKKYIGQIYAWLLKIFQCNLGLPETYQDAEFGVPPRTEEQRRICRTNLKYGKCWTDGSGNGEFESADPAKAEAMRMLIWGDKRIPQRVEALEDSVAKINDSVQQIVSYFDVPSKPDTFQGGA